MELFVQRLNLLVHSLAGLRLACAHVLSTILSRALLLVAGQAHICVELGDFVGVLARGGDLDRAGPVEVEMAESKGEVLNIQLADVGRCGVQGHVEVCGQHATLGCVGRGQVEVENACALRVVLLDEGLVDDAARWWVDQLVRLGVMNEEALCDALVYNDNSDFGRLANLVVKFRYDGPELR